MADTIDKAAALDSLYSQIEPVVEAMGGSAFRSGVGRGFPGPMVATPRSEEVPALNVEMQGEFRLEFAPRYPLSIGNAVSVHVSRSHPGVVEDDWNFNFGPSGWYRTQPPLTDDEIRTCLTPNRLPSAW
jgi:hypothetical protein